MKIVTRDMVSDMVRQLRAAAAGGPLPSFVMEPEGPRDLAAFGVMADEVEKMFSQPPVTEADIAALIAAGGAEDLRPGNRTQ